MVVIWVGWFLFMRFLEVSIWVCVMGLAFLAYRVGILRLPCFLATLACILAVVAFILFL